MTLLESINGLKKGSITSVGLTKACFDQIDKYDSKIKAFLTLTKDSALVQASDADEEIKKHGEKSFENKPLLGIPYACKDNFNTYGIQTTAGSKILEGYIPPYESTVTSRIKSAGAVLLGKTNMDAFAHGSSTETSDYMKTTNPWNYNKVPGGSSGGSAAAVASDMCIFSIGSETAGSVRGPAAWCGVTGLKPTYGRVSRYGLIAMASSTDSPGPITKNTEDAAYILSVIAGSDPFDATTSHTPIENYLKKTYSYNLKGKKIGRPKSYFNIELEPEIRVAMENVFKVYEELGAQVIDMDLLDPKYSIAVYTILQRSEVSSNLARFDGIRYGNERTAFGFEAKKRMMLGAYTLSAGYYDQYYAKAQRVRTLIVEDFKKAFESVDLIIGPTMPCVALDFGANESSSMFGELMDVLLGPSSIAGLTSISVPAGTGNELPVGFQILGPMFAESAVLGAAHKFQGVTNFHKEKPNLI
ncbi:Asp-tRNA(Asn)/Glu-tRNA(Gln) amidotransferase subunit GatA [candidate division WWE3 bacterium]|uniref:Glutamyl-tRNA(Gln) amidotransferase subunit A n=1 Tax=candidate division WWE3 bacterium TaxID=2053526 RepID=A0A3A4ZJ11_UNCKA|nr:MAG: Asp-tRNA(Asn)/Glu-tRNA(Gln) amidotransferase subunit GatA [candidate division WWE3 bacterium]